MKNKEAEEWEHWKRENKQPRDYDFEIKAMAVVTFVLVGLAGLFVLVLIAGAETVTFNISEAFSMIGKGICIGVVVLVLAACMVLMIPDGRIR